MLALLLVFIAVMASATFIENDYGIVVSWNQIYDALWFEAIMLALCGCFIANIFKYQLLQIKKWALLLFHLAFITILIGAAITRYTSLSGVLRVREGETTSTIISSEKYLQLKYLDRDCQTKIECEKIEKKKVALSFEEKQQFNWELEFKKKPLFVRVTQYVPKADILLQKNELKGKPSVEMVLTEGNQNYNFFLQENQQKRIGNNKHIIEFGTPTTVPKKETTILIIEKEGQLWMKVKENLEHFEMKMNKAVHIEKDKMHLIQIRNLYQGIDFSFMFLNHLSKGEKIIITENQTLEKGQTSQSSQKKTHDIVVLELMWEKEVTEAMLLYKEGFLPQFETIKLGENTIDIGYGSSPISMPFALQLDDFRLTRYPGSDSPSTYESDITIIDQEKNIPYMIYMNNVLDWEGFRFYQASYDSDEQGTVLSVNKDWWGTQITYLGYIMLVIGMFFTLFGRHSHFHSVRKKLKDLANQKYCILFFLFLSFSLLNFDGICAKTNLLVQDEKEINSTLDRKIPFVYVDKDLADKWGQILVQDINGRIKPMNTLALEILRKVSGKRQLSFSTSDTSMQKTMILDANQIMLSIHVFPNQWKKIDLIKWDKKKIGLELVHALFSSKNIDDKKLLSFNDFFDTKGNYLLREHIESVNIKNPSLRNVQEKELLAVDERVNILLNLLKGKYTKIFPNKSDMKQTWYAHTHHFNDFPLEDRNFAKNILSQLFQEIIQNKHKEAWEKMSYIQTYQKTLAKDIIPTDKQIQAELWYNQLNANFWLFILFTVSGVFLLFLSIIKIFFNRSWLIWIQEILIILILIGGVCFTASLVLRWYIGGQAPWSNGYEMLVFVAWVLVVCGFFSHKTTDFGLPLSTFFSGVLLFISYLDWLNPAITPLMPVLKSYWLKVHVTTIVSSYAPLTLSALLGIMALLLIVFCPKNKYSLVSIKIKELTYLNELSMIIGLFVLTIGTFLGGVWANESWGRYWAWDPKETWALISIIVYAFTLHLRFIPKFNNYVVLNIASMFSFWSIIMTSFGVNYYLSGLHSYATGDPVPIPKFVYVVIAFMLLLSFLAIRKQKRLSLE